MITAMEPFFFVSNDLIKLDFLFVGFDKRRSLQKKGGHTRRILAAILGAATSIVKIEEHLGQRHSSFTHNLQSALRLTMGIFEHLF